MTENGGHSSVRGLKSRFEQLQTNAKPKPPVAAKPGFSQDGNKSAKPTTKAKPILFTQNTSANPTPNLSPLTRTQTIESNTSDPFGSPVNSPDITSSNDKPLLSLHGPRISLNSESSPDSSPDSKVTGLGT